ncbi:MAG TPA: aldo/keto reductase [Terrimicrobiaceae bacterium]|nr:aldo/keto reductase [Terrimicrobiaceae bacterium]
MCLEFASIARGLGTQNVGLKPGAYEENSHPIIKRALGINFFDTTNVYFTGQSEEILGRA